MSPDTNADNAEKVGSHSHVVITITRHGRPGRYRAYIEAEQALCVSRQPLLDGARKLIARGFDARTMLVMRWAGSKEWALRAPLRLAAKLTVDEHNGTVFAKWKPFSRSAGSPRIVNSGQGASGGPGELKKPFLDGTAEKVCGRDLIGKHHEIEALQ